VEAGDATRAGAAVSVGADLGGAYRWRPPHHADEDEPMPTNPDLPPVPTNPDLPPVPTNPDLPPVPTNPDLPPVPTNPDLPPVPTNPVLETLPSYFTQALDDALDRDALIDLSIGDPHEPTPPAVRRALIEAVTPESSYPSAAGQPALRAAIADWFARRHGVTADPDRHILASAGSKEAIFHLPLAVIDAHGDRRGVLWGEPGYPVYDRGTRFAGGISDPVLLTPDRGWRLELESLPAERIRSSSIVWINYPHNPTGATADLAYLRRQVEIAREHGVLLASDECYQDITFDAPAPSVLEACDGDLTGVLAVVSLSKRSGMTGYRSGAIVGDPDLIARLRRLRTTTGTASPSFVQAAATAAWQDDTHVEERREIFAQKRAILLDHLERHAIEVSGSEATLYLWFRAPGGDDIAYGQAMQAAGLLATPGRGFGHAGAGWMRLALVPTIEECHLAVQRWAAAIAEGRLPT
jgi:succinyldiaminopimelate transaminase